MVMWTTPPSRPELSTKLRGQAWAGAPTNHILWSLLVIAMVVAACGPGGSSPSPSLGQTLTGTFTLNNGKLVDRSATDCKGTDGYDDMASGVDATIKNATGVIIGKADLVARGGDVSRLAFICIYDFQIPNVPPSEFYVVAVGDRGEETFSAGELNATGWHVDFTLGS